MSSEERFRKFDGRSGISSEDYYSGSSSRSNQRGQIDGIKDGVREGVRSVAGKLSNIASDLASTLQVSEFCKEAAICAITRVTNIFLACALILLEYFFTGPLRLTADVLQMNLCLDWWLSCFQLCLVTALLPKLLILLIWCCCSIQEKSWFHPLDAHFASWLHLVDTVSFSVEFRCIL